MAIHQTIVSLVKESLPEYLDAAKYCVAYKKSDRWGIEQSGGCLGYPAVALLFCIVDSIGSYHRGKTGFIIHVDGKEIQIKNDTFHHFFILNSSYYGLELSEKTIKKLYDNYRSLLLHNAALALDHALFLGDPALDPFALDNERVHINVSAFLRVTELAVSKFMEDIDKVVPGSEQEKNIRLKK